MGVFVPILMVTSHNANINGIMRTSLNSWFYATDLRPPGCCWAHPQCCSPPPLRFCPPASSSCGSCGRGSQPGSWRRPCWPQDHPGGCPWCPPPPGAGCIPPAERIKKVEGARQWQSTHYGTSLGWPFSVEPSSLCERMFLLLVNHSTFL